MSEPTRTAYTIAALQRAISARILSLPSAPADSIVAIDGTEMLLIVVQIAAVWATADPEGFGYAMAGVVGDAHAGDLEPEFLAEMRQGLAAWLTEHALGRCTKCLGDV